MELLRNFKLNILYRQLPYIVIIAIGICSFLFSLDMSYIGDDLNHIFIYSDKYPHWYERPLIIPFSWLAINGRFADMAYGILSLSIPKWLLAIISAAFETLFYLFILKLSGLRSNQVLLKLILIALVMFTFCWWDSFFLFIVKVNYLWTVTAILITSWFILFPGKKEANKKWSWFMIPFALIAGWGHEAAGAPVSLGFLVYFLICKDFKRYPLYNKLIMTSFVIGNILCLSSPGIWNRFGSERIPDDSMMMLLLKSSFYALILIMIIISLFLSKSGRNCISKLIHSYWIVFVIAGISQLAFIIAGGIVGRSGWFSQTYSIISILGIIHIITYNRRYEIRMYSRILSYAIFAVLLFHEIGICRLQMRANKQLISCEKKFCQSTDGIVFADPIQRNQFPWWALNKNKACVDNDDFWMIKVYDHRIGQNQKRYRLLPKVLETFTSADLKGKDIIRIGNGFVSAKLSDKQFHTFRIWDEVYDAIPFTSTDGIELSYISKRIIDPGDRNYYTRY